MLVLALFVGSALLHLSILRLRVIDLQPGDALILASPHVATPTSSVAMLTPLAHVPPHTVALQLAQDVDAVAISSTSPPSSFFTPTGSAVHGQQPLRYLVFFTYSGFGNQVIMFRLAICIANALNRVLVVPPLLSSHVMSRADQWFNELNNSHTSGSIYRVRFDASLVDQYEKTAQFFRVNTSVLTTHTVVHLSSLLASHGSDFDCWNGNHSTVGEPPFVDSDNAVLCIGSPFRLRLPPTIAPMSNGDWLLFDDAVAASSMRWLAEQRMLNTPFTCVHYRSGDFRRYLGPRFVNLSQVVRFMHEAQLESSAATLVLTIADSAEEVALLNELGWKRMNMAQSDKESNDRVRTGMQQIAMEQFLCTRSSVFVGCSLSTFAMLIRSLRRCASSTAGCCNYCA